MHDGTSALSIPHVTSIGCSVLCRAVLPMHTALLGHTARMTRWLQLQASALTLQAFTRQVWSHAGCLNWYVNSVQATIPGFRTPGHHSGGGQYRG